MVQELLICPFDNDFIDYSGRHTLYNGNPGYECGTVTFAEGRLGTASAYFDGTSFLISTDDTTHIVGDHPGEFYNNAYTGLTLTQLPNADDFLLGATKVIQDFFWDNWVTVNSDNNFTIDCWVRPELGGERYYPICSSAYIGQYGGGYKIGWALQIDTATGRLQMIGYSAGDWLGSVIESQFEVPFDEWTHITVSVWLVPGWPSPTAQMMYKNGIATSNFANFNNICRFGNGMFPPSLPPDGWQYAPFFIGLGPRSQFTDQWEAWHWDLNPWYGYHFKGRIDNLRICLGSRWPVANPTQLTDFTPPGIATTTTTTETTTASTSAGWTTYSTTTYSSTSYTSTTYYPEGLIRDFLILPFDRSSADSTLRHSTADLPTLFSEDRKRGITSAYFDRGSKLEYLLNEDDWGLGTTSCGLYCMFSNNSSWYSFASIPDNSFSISSWIKLEAGGNRYYPICSSINSVGTGWVFQVDTLSKKLQMIGFAIGSHLLDFTYLPNSKDQNGVPINAIINLVMESSFTLDYNIWTHIALVSYRVLNQIAAKIMYKDGIPDRSPGWIPSHVVWSSGGQVVINNPTIGFGSLNVGYCQRLDLPNSRNLGDYFKGYIDYLRITEGSPFPVDGTVFTPPIDPITTETTATSTATTITTETTSTATTLSTMTTSTTYGTTSQTTNTTATTSQTTSTTTQTYTTTITTSTTSVTSTFSTSTGTTLSYTTTTTWTTTTISYTTTTPIPPYTRVSIGGRAQASDYIGGYEPSKAFDHDISTFWLCSPYENPPYWLSYSWTEDSYVVDEYKLYLTTGGRPKDWEFQGSNNGVNWDILDERYSMETDELIDIVIDNTTAYSTYRLYITAVWSRLYAIRVNEFQLYSNRNVNKPESSMHWLGYDFNESVLIQRYCMLAPPQSGFNEWKLQGSNDGIFWSDVDHKVQPDWVGWKCIEIESNELSFSRWRLLIMNWSRFSNPGLVEFELFQRP